MFKLLAKNHEILVTVEDGSIGGFSAHVMSFLAKEGLLDNGSNSDQSSFLINLSIMVNLTSKILNGIDSANIVNTVLNALGIVSPTKLSLERA